MSKKILTDRELGEIVRLATSDESIIDDADDYKHFLEDLTDLVCRHFGGVRGDVLPPIIYASVSVNDVPENGGIFKDFGIEA